MTYNLGIDVGGTFTDFLLVDNKGGYQIFKSLSTPNNPFIGVQNGLEEISKSNNMELKEFLSQVNMIVHGTTITTNSVLTRKGSKSAFITTKGFRDVLNMRRGLRDRQYDSRYNPPEPFIKRRDIYTVEERVDCEGKIITPLNEKDMETIISSIRDKNITAVGVSTLFSFMNPENEKLIGKMLRNAFPEIYISLSNEILPQVRLYERNSTVALNAYVGPILSSYLEQAAKGLYENGFQATLLIMQSNGGVMSPELSSRFAVNTLFSGPAGGPVTAIHMGDIHGLENIITVDMGGTSFDMCVIKDRLPAITTEGEIGGYRVALPTLSIETIGAGGGSIASIDAEGMLKVGPQSAGAEPGPVCYNNGGTEPTVTDADLILGYLDPEYFHGGAIKLDKLAASNAIEKYVANKLGISVIEAAAGIYKMINTNMALGVNLVSVGKGHDPRNFAMVVAGGAGPIHAAMIAKEQDIPLVMVPRGSSVFCATGMLMSDLKHDYVRTYTTEFSKIDLGLINEICSSIAIEAKETLIQEGIPENRIYLYFTADIRYLGQFNEVNVALPMSSELDIRIEDIEQLESLFHHTHDQFYGYSLPEATLELMNIRLQAVGETIKPRFKATTYNGPDASKALKNHREVFFDDKFITTPVYDGLNLKHGNKISGPAIVEEPTTTVLIPPDFDLICDSYDNYMLYRKNHDLKETIAKLKQN